VVAAVDLKELLKLDMADLAEVVEAQVATDLN
jgi:hypothetical protein